MTSYDGFRLARENDRGVATITLDVPDKLNRVSMEAREELARVFGELGGDDAVRVVVLRGAGDQAFTAGGDVAMFMQRDAEALSHLHVNVGAPERCPKPVIAQLHGYCFGVGLELALACDFRVASDDVQLALPELTLGMIPGSGGAHVLTPEQIVLEGDVPSPILGLRPYVQHHHLAARQPLGQLGRRHLLDAVPITQILARQHRHLRHMQRRHVAHRRPQIRDPVTR
jgi:hypothetical protein